VVDWYDGATSVRTEIFHSTFWGDEVTEQGDNTGRHFVLGWAFGGPGTANLPLGPLTYGISLYDWTSCYTLVGTEDKTGSIGWTLTTTGYNLETGGALGHRGTGIRILRPVSTNIAHTTTVVFIVKFGHIPADFASLDPVLLLLPTAAAITHSIRSFVVSGWIITVSCPTSGASLLMIYGVIASTSTSTGCAGLGNSQVNGKNEDYDIRPHPYSIGLYARRGLE